MFSPREIDAARQAADMSHTELCRRAFIGRRTWEEARSRGTWATTSVYNKVVSALPESVVADLEAGKLGSEQSGAATPDTGQ